MYSIYFEIYTIIVLNRVHDFADVRSNKVTPFPRLDCAQPHASFSTYVDNTLICKSLFIICVYLFLICKLNEEPGSIKQLTIANI